VRCMVVMPFGGWRGGCPTVCVCVSVERRGKDDKFILEGEINAAE